MNREVIYSALFDLLVQATGVTTSSRRLKHFADVSAADQPALFMQQASEIAKIVTRQPTRWELMVHILLYVNTADQAPGQALNPLLDAVTNALIPANPDNVQTLGGLVEYARIEGQIEIFEGAMDNEAIARVPVTILTT